MMPQRFGRMELTAGAARQSHIPTDDPSQALVHFSPLAKFPPCKASGGRGTSGSQSREE